MGTSSANPDRLDAYVRAAQTLNDTLQQRLGSLDALHSAVVPRLGWGAFDASATLSALAMFIKRNQVEDQGVAVVSQAFRLADNGSGPVIIADALIEGALRAAGLMAPPTGSSCAQTLACTIEDFNQMSIDERRAFVAEFQRLYGEWFYSAGKWNNIDGVLQFLSEDGLSRPGTWESWVDASILHGFERGAAMALDRPGGNQGNPGADRWLRYFVTMRTEEGTLSKAEADNLWSEGEQASTEHGYDVAARHGTSPGLPQLSFAVGGEAYRWILRQEAEIDAGMEAAGRTNPLLWPVTQLGREALYDFTDPANRYPSYLGGHILHGVGRGAEGGVEIISGLSRNDPLAVGEGVIDVAEGTGEVVRYGGEAAARGTGWLWQHTFGR